MQALYFTVPSIVRKSLHTGQLLLWRWRQSEQSRLTVFFRHHQQLSDLTSNDGRGEETADSRTYTLAQRNKPQGRQERGQLHRILKEITAAFDDMC